MLSISVARSREDFEAAEGLCTKLGEWDAAIAPDHGLTPAQVLAAFHSESLASLSEKFSSADAKFLIARWEDMPAGSLAFDALDETCAELHRFYVDDRFAA